MKCTTHIPHNPDVMQTVCEVCGKEILLNVGLVAQVLLDDVWETEEETCQ
jgi:phosphohistidine phosphatase SixA